VNSLLRRALAAAAALLLAPALAGCGKAVSTSAFKGEQHEVAQAISNLQADASASDETKICADDLARATAARLQAAPGGCHKAVKDQLNEIDNDELAVDSVQLGPGTPPRSATARVRSIFSGKTVRSTLMLVKEGSRWKIAGVG
jgi:hypothetical protein